MKKYDVTRIAPKDECFAGIGCPAVYYTKTQEYLIVGKEINPQEAGLESRVGPGEKLVAIPKNVLDELRKYFTRTT